MYHSTGAGTIKERVSVVYLWKALGLEVHSVIFDKEHIKKELNSGRPIVCILGPGDFTTTGHFIVLTGVDENGGIIVNDPNSIINSKKAGILNS